MIGHIVRHAVAGGVKLGAKAAHSGAVKTVGVARAVSLVGFKKVKEKAFKKKKPGAKTKGVKTL